jgi:hypothetical protein
LGACIVAWILAALATTNLRAGTVEGPVRIGSIDWDPAIASFAPECATTFWQERRSSLCMMDAVLDAAGSVHLFLARWDLSNTFEHRTIEHYLLSNGEVRSLAPLNLEKATVEAFRAATTKDGSVALVWLEKEFFTPDYHPKVMYLASFREGTWTPARIVSDPEGKPFASHDVLVLRANDDDSLDLFWNDYREHHFWAAFFTMGEGGDYLRTYHRRITGDDLGVPERIQSRDDPEPDAFAVMPQGSGPAGILWSWTSGSVATIRRSVFSGGHWKAEERVGQCSASLGKPAIMTLEIAGDDRGGARVAWVCDRDEVTEPGTRKNASFSNLYVSSLQNGTWSTGPVLFRAVDWIHWLWNEPGKAGLLLQESAPVAAYPARRERKPVPLFIETIEGNRSAGREMLAGHVVTDSVIAATDAQGNVHVIYAEPTSGTEAVLRYRHGRHGA